MRTLDIDISTPTDAAPGSEEKIAVLEARYACGLPLFMDDDNQQAERTRTLNSDPGRIETYQAERFDEPRHRLNLTSTVLTSFGAES
jgi:hypothetical protein